MDVREVLDASVHVLRAQIADQPPFTGDNGVPPGDRSVETVSGDVDPVSATCPVGEDGVPPHPVGPSSASVTPPLSGAPVKRPPSFTSFEDDEATRGGRQP